GQNSPFLKRNALGPPLPSLHRRRRHCPYASGGRRPSTGWPRVGAAPVVSPRAVNPCGLTAGGHYPSGLTAGEQPLRAGRWPLPLAGATLQPAAPTAGRPLAGGQAMVGRPYRRPSRGWPPILLLAAFVAKCCKNA
ncbi:hypothetical protein BHM03_00049388, partial [Ensete ventricosum]